MAKTKRLNTVYSKSEMAMIQRITEAGSFITMSEAVRNSLKLVDALQQQAAMGFTEIVLRNPETQAEKVVLIPLVIQDEETAVTKTLPPDLMEMADKAWRLSGFAACINWDGSPNTADWLQGLADMIDEFQKMAIAAGVGKLGGLTIDDDTVHAMIAQARRKEEEDDAADS